MEMWMGGIVSYQRVDIPYDLIIALIICLIYRSIPKCSIITIIYSTYAHLVWIIFAIQTDFFFLISLCLWFYLRKKKEEKEEEEDTN